MKKKVIFSLSLACFFGIMWLSSTFQTTNVKPIISEEPLTPPKESNPLEHIDEESPETTNMDNGTQESDILAVKACSFNFIETDVFTFGNAFKHYRECLGSNNSFQWRGNTYTTFLSEEIIIEIADSTQVKVKTRNNHEVSETH